MLWFLVDMWGRRFLPLASASLNPAALTLLFLVAIAVSGANLCKSRVCQLLQLLFSEIFQILLQRIYLLNQILDLAPVTTYLAQLSGVVLMPHIKQTSQITGLKTLFSPSLCVVTCSFLSAVNLLSISFKTGQ